MPPPSFFPFFASLVFRGRRIEWRYFRFDRIQDGGLSAMFENSNGDISATDHSISSMFDSGGVFADGGSTGAISSLSRSKMAARPPSWQIQMAISPRRIIRFTPCLVLGWGFWGRRIEWRYFQFEHINRSVGEKCTRSN